MFLDWRIASPRLPPSPVIIVIAVVVVVVNEALVLVVCVYCKSDCLICIILRTVCVVRMHTDNILSSTEVQEGWEELGC